MTGVCLARRVSAFCLTVSGSVASDVVLKPGAEMGTTALQFHTPHGTQPPAFPPERNICS